MLFAITDIETTGHHASGNSIIEIAVCLFDGKRVIDEFHTLVNPDVPIPHFITRLTGIDDKMLEDAPSFSSIADDLETFFQDAVFVAHNVNFDYSFVRAEFRAIGIDWNPRRLCTVRLGRKVFPGLRSYSLSSQCEALSIINDSPHRALGDARATAQLFAKQLERIAANDLKKFIAKVNGDVFLPHHIDRPIFDALPESPGVYYMLDEKGKPLYIGKAKNIRKRVRSHFAGDLESARLQRFLDEIRDIRFQETAHEVIAVLLEDTEIRKHWPKYNNAQKQRVVRYGIFEYFDQRGYKRWAVNALAKHQMAWRYFPSPADARNFVIQFGQAHHLDLRLLGIEAMEITETLPSPAEHNERFGTALALHEQSQLPTLLVGQGRTEEEQTFLVLENGFAVAFGFAYSDSAFLTTPANIDDYIQQRFLPTDVNASVARQLLEHPRGFRAFSLQTKASHVKKIHNKEL